MRRNSKFAGIPKGVLAGAALEHCFERGVAGVGWFILLLLLGLLDGELGLGLLGLLGEGGGGEGLLGLLLEGCELVLCLLLGEGVQAWGAGACWLLLLLHFGSEGIIGAGLHRL